MSFNDGKRLKLPQYFVDVIDSSDKSVVGDKNFNQRNVQRKKMFLKLMTLASRLAALLIETVNVPEWQIRVYPRIRKSLDTVPLDEQG